MSAQRASAWRHGYHALVCSSAEPWAHGTVVRALDVAARSSAARSRRRTRAAPATR
jgi:hypothetical protein